MRITPEDLGTIKAALLDAASYREPVSGDGFCWACGDGVGDLCAGHRADSGRARACFELYGRLGEWTQAGEAA